MAPTPGGLPRGYAITVRAVSLCFALVGLGLLWRTLPPTGTEATVLAAIGAGLVLVGLAGVVRPAAVLSDDAIPDARVR